MPESHRHLRIAVETTRIEGLKETNVEAPNTYQPTSCGGILEVSDATAASRLNGTMILVSIEAPTLTVPGQTSPKVTIHGRAAGLLELE